MTHRIERVSEDTLIVGIDIAKHTHWAQFTDSRGVVLCKPVRVENTINGFSILLNKISELQASHGCNKVLLGFEPSGHYWRTLAWFFKTTAGVQLVGVNPYHVKQLKELEDNTQTKNDKKDALVISHLIKDGHYFDLYMPEDEYAELRILRKHRDQMSEDRKRAVIRITNILDEYFPEFSTVSPNINTVSTRIILRTTPFPCDVINLTGDELRLIWKEHRTGKGIRIGRNSAAQLIEVARSSVGITVGIEASRQRLNDILNQMDMLDCQIEYCDQAMNEIIDRLDVGRYLTSVPGVGDVIAASFIAETGDLDRFEDWKQLRKLAGLNLVEQSSGQHKGKTKISKRGRPGLRRLVYLIGDKGMLVSPEMMAFYQYLRHRPENSLKHDQAVLAVGLKLMRIMFHVVKYKEYYDPEKALGEVRLLQIKNAA